MVGPPKKRGSASTSRSRDVDENEDIIEERHEGEKSSKLRISTDGFWFEHEKVIKKVREAIEENYNEYIPSWTKASRQVRDRWWNAFKDEVSVSVEEEREARIAFENCAKLRLKDMIYRASKCDSNPRWMPEDVHTRLRERYNQEDFKKKSEVASANRKSGGGEKGKAVGTHTMGRKNTFRAMEKMIMGGGNDTPNAFDVLKMSKTKKKGGWVSKKAAAIAELFTSKKSERVQQSQQEEEPDNTPIDDNQLYYEVAGGYNVKGRVYGTGNTTSQFFQRNSFSGTSAAATDYTPGVYATLAQKVNRMEEFLQKFNYDRNFDPSCNPGASGGRDDDIDPSGQGGTSSSTPLPPPQIPIA